MVVLSPVVVVPVVITGLGDAVVVIVVNDVDTVEVEDEIEGVIVVMVVDETNV